jgi:hypothetical protein
MDDTFDKYKTVLNEPRQMRDLLGNSYKSEIKYVNEKKIGGKTWIDSLQFGSEIQGFYTRYTATIFEKIAALLTYSIADSVYAKWANLLDGVVNSAEVFFDPNAFADIMSQRPSSLLGARNSLKSKLAPSAENETLGGKTKGLDPAVIIGVVVLAGAVAFLVWKKKQKKSALLLLTWLKIKSLLYNLQKVYL